MIRYMPVVCSAIFLAACGNPSATPVADAPAGTVVMRDGTKVQGKIVQSSAKDITVAAADNTTRTIPMAQVKRVEYAEVTPPAAPPAPAAAPAEPAEPEHEDHPHPTELAITSKTHELPAGTQISVRTEETIDSGKAAEGQTFAAEVTRSVKDSAGDVVIPRASNAQIVIRSSSKGGKFHGTADLIMDLDSVSIDGRRYRLSTVDLREKGHEGVGINQRTGKFAGGGAAVGAIIGAIAGGGKGAAIGAGSGAGAGALTQVLTKGGSIKVPVESILTFKLDRTLRVETAQ
jgi:ribosome maturation factor RimP